jgi:serine/threonine protein kinase
MEINEAEFFFVAPTWLAPEVLSANAYSEKVDCYAIGIIMWEILAGGHPFEEFNFKFNSALEEAIISGLRPTVPPVPENQAKNPILRQVHERYTTLMQRCWDNSPFARPAANEIHASLLELESLLCPINFA